jgi:hypothetical protein
LPDAAFVGTGEGVGRDSGTADLPKIAQEIDQEIE